MLEIFDTLFAPLARILVARGLTFSDLTERLKLHCVRAAMAQARAQGHKVTDSRLSLMTGLARRDVARLREHDIKPPRPSPLTRLVGVWAQSPQYDARPLPRTGPAPSFESLAREVLQDVHPRSLLDPLLEAGTCEEIGDLLHLRARAYIPARGSDDQLAYLTGHVGDHMSAATDNVLADGPAPHFERALHIAGLSPEDASILQDRFAAAQMALLEELQREASALKSDNPGPVRVRLGSYSLTSESP